MKGRKPLFGKAMTASERKARSRAMKREGLPKKKRGRPPVAGSARTREQQNEIRKLARREERAIKSSKRKTQIAVLDFETNPFKDNDEIFPFVAELYTGDKSIVIWNEDFDSFINEVYLSILGLDGAYTVYAHNGGKFDFMFLVKLLRGKVSFKGRGIMSAFIGPHELRDSMHIIPTRLGDYKKDDFDYSLLEPSKRKKNKPKILKYLHSDCVYLYDLVKDFVERHGRVLSIGQAAFGVIKAHYTIKTLSEHSDEYFRRWFFGGRVECLKGPGIFHGDFELIDVNSMYPHVMATYTHPVGADFYSRSGGKPNENTRFLEVECTNFGALVGRDENGALTPNIKRGIFYTTLWEYQAALELDLIRDVKIVKCVDMFDLTDFKKFVYPLYEAREQNKIKLIENPDMVEEDVLSIERELLFDKFLLNNGYGKFAQNPRKFREYYYTDYGAPPPGENTGPMQYTDDDGGIWSLESSVEDEFCVWKKPLPKSQLRFNNVATAASITGAARSVLLRELARSKNPYYCDTDSIIRARQDDISPSSQLGSWNLEATFGELMIAGKKMYGFRGEKEKIRAKGCSKITWHELKNVINGIPVKNRSAAPAIKRTGEQFFIERTIKLTCPAAYRSRIFEA